MKFMHFKIALPLDIKIDRFQVDFLLISKEIHTFADKIPIFQAKCYTVQCISVENYIYFHQMNRFQ